jgi:membrane protein DedA with SNARE-associated domain
MSAEMGLAALGFWIFLATVVGGGIWYDIRRKESQQETLRRLVESGHQIDPAVLDRIVGEGGAKDLGRDLRVAAYIMIPIAPGLAVLGLFLGQIAPEPKSALLGVAVLVAFVAAGLFMAARFVERRHPDQQD